MQTVSHDNGQIAESASHGTPSRPPEYAPTTSEVDMGLLPDLLGYWLRRAQVAVFQDFMQTMAEAGITPGQFGVLTVIGANEGLSQSAVAEALGTERSTMVALVDRLERDALVVRRRLTTDRRTYALALTEAGTALLEHLERMVAAHEARIAEALSESERETLMSLLRRVGQRG